MTRIRGCDRSRIRNQISETGWWSSSAQTFDDIDPRWLWGAGTAKSLSATSGEGDLHVLSVHCVEYVNSKGQNTVRVILECEEGIYYRDSGGLVGQIQGILNWFGPVENWPPVRIGRPSELYPRYTIIPQF